MKADKTDQTGQILELERFWGYDSMKLYDMRKSAVEVIGMKGSEAILKVYNIGQIQQGKIRSH